MPFSFTAHGVAHDVTCRVLHRACILALTGLVSLPAFASEEPLTLERAQQRAVAHSRQLSAQDMATAASHDMAIAAGQLPDPTLKFGIDNLPINGSERFSVTDDFMTMRRIGLEQEWIRTDKRRLQSEHYEREADKSEVQKIVVVAAVERDTALAWLDCYYAQQMFAAIKEQVTQVRLEIEAAEAAYRGGRGSQADILAAHSALAAIEDRASEVDRKVRNARIMLARWTGAAVNMPLAGQPAIDTIRLDPATLDSTLGHHPEIAVLNKQVDIAETDAKLAQANKQSDWSVDVSFQQRGPAYSNMVSVGFSLPLQWDQQHRQNRELSAKLAMLEQSKALRDEMLREHIAETRTMIEEWQNDRERSARYEEELIPLAKQRIDAVLAAYSGGKANLTDLLAARRSAIDTRIQALQLQTDTAHLWAQLNFLFPIDTDGHIGMQMNEDSQ